MKDNFVYSSNVKVWDIVNHLKMPIVNRFQLRAAVYALYWSSNSVPTMRQPMVYVQQAQYVQLLFSSSSSCLIHILNLIGIAIRVPPAAKWTNA